MNKILFAVLVFCWCAATVAKSQDIALLQRELDQSSILKNHFFGFSLYDVEQNIFLAGANDDKYFTPASNTKIFTLFTALKNIGDSIPGIYYIERGDSLLFWGTGDPTFLHPKLESGRIYDFLRNSEKKLYYVGEETTDEPFYRDGWAMEDYNAYFQPEISALPIYGNVATFRNSGSRLAVHPAHFEPDMIWKDNGHVGRFRIQRQWDDNIFHITKMKIPHNYVNEKPFKYSDELFVKLLQDTLQRPVELLAYQKPIDIDTLFSTATVDVLREMMLESDNFLAEQLMMVAARNKYGAFHTAALRKDMEALYYTYFMYKSDLYDGSGLSPYNKVTPRTLVELLLMIKEEMPQMDELYYLFPAGGVEGTLKTTYRIDAGMPFIWAKTGTIKSVYCQSGYIQTRSGRNFVFSFLNNNVFGSIAPVRLEVARIMTFIREHY